MLERGFGSREPVPDSQKSEMLAPQTARKQSPERSFPAIARDARIKPKETNEDLKRALAEAREAIAESIRDDEDPTIAKPQTEVQKALADSQSAIKEAMSFDAIPELSKPNETTGIETPTIPRKKSWRNMWGMLR